MNTDDIRCRIMEEELGTFWPQWHVVKRLGGGAFGDVFEIYRDNHGVRTCSALKVLRVNNMEAAYAIPSKNAGPNNAGGSRSNYGEDDIPEVFLNEIWIMEALHGAPNIVYSICASVASELCVIQKNKFHVFGVFDVFILVGSS